MALPRQNKTKIPNQTNQTEKEVGVKRGERLPLAGKMEAVTGKRERARSLEWKKAIAKLLCLRGEGLITSPKETEVPSFGLGDPHRAGRFATFSSVCPRGGA